MSGDAYHITAPTEDGSGPCASWTWRCARRTCRAAQVGYINAHGTSTPHNDRIETLAIKKLFGEHAYKLAISSTKSMTGHLLGAAGGLEAGISALACTIRPRLPPSTSRTRSGLRSRLRARQVPPVKMEYALSNSFGFGGRMRRCCFDARVDAQPFEMQIGRLADCC
jgi:3-oxoacyl-[acyl-carrier-protein] synthase II